MSLASFGCDDELVADGRALQLDLVVVGAVGGEQRARVLKVLALSVALQRLERPRLGALLAVTILDVTFVTSFLGRLAPPCQSFLRPGPKPMVEFLNAGVS